MEEDLTYVTDDKSGCFGEDSIEDDMGNTKNCIFKHTCAIDSGNMKADKAAGTDFLFEDDGSFFLSNKVQIILYNYSTLLSVAIYYSSSYGHCRFSDNFLFFLAIF